MQKNKINIGKSLFLQKKNFKKAFIAPLGLASAHLLSQGVRLEKEPFEPFELIITNLNHS